MNEWAYQKNPKSWLNWFNERGISDIDEFTISVSRSKHNEVHNDYKWNQKWEEFIQTYPNASPSQIFYQTELMMRDVGLKLHKGYEKYKWGFLRRNPEARKK